MHMLMRELELQSLVSCVYRCVEISPLFVVGHGFPLPSLTAVTTDIIILNNQVKQDIKTGDSDQVSVSSLILRLVIRLVNV